MVQGRVSFTKRLKAMVKTKASRGRLRGPADGRDGVSHATEGSGVFGGFGKPSARDHHRGQVGGDRDRGFSGQGRGSGGREPPRGDSVSPTSS